MRRVYNMTQVKTDRQLFKEFKDANVDWWMQAAASVIIEAGLQKRFETKYNEIAAQNGHPDIFKELVLPGKDNKNRRYFNAVS